MNFKLGTIHFYLLSAFFLITQSTLAQVHKKQKPDNVVAEMQVICHSDSIVLKINTNHPFNGMVYAKDSPNNNNCVSEYNSSTNMTFRLPLKSCGTLFAEADDGIEYFNTVVVQPHMRLMTNQGRGYHIRCKYQTRERTIANTHFNVSASFLMQNNPQAINTPLLATASMPSCTMKIFRSGRDDVAETVKIGDKLIMVIEIDQQDMYGMKITNCVVRDGLNTAEQQLINDLGCPLDENIMPKFEYTNNSTRAAVSFPAHKFPHTSSVYYQCNVRLCINNNGGCEPTDCSGSNNSSHNNSGGGGPRMKRFANHDHQRNKIGLSSQKLSASAATSMLPEVASSLPLPEPSALAAPATVSKETVAGDMSFDVYSGLYVSDIDVGESGSGDGNGQVSPAPPPSNRRSNGDDSNNTAAMNSNGTCLNLGQASLLALLASVASVGVSLMLVCQIRSFGEQRDSSQQVAATSSKIFSPRLQYPSSISYADYERHGRRSGMDDLGHHSMHDSDGPLSG